MENKTTTELLDLLWKTEKKGEKNGTGNWDEYGEIYAELRKRTPFSDILGVKEDQNDMSIEEKVEKLEEELKLLKRHKHDNHTGDVMVRI